MRREQVSAIAAALALEAVAGASFALGVIATLRILA